MPNIKPEELVTIIDLLEKDGNNEVLLQKIKLMKEIDEVGSDAQKKLIVLNQQLHKLNNPETK